MFFSLKYSVVFLLIFFVMSVFLSFIINWLFLKLSFNLGTRNSRDLQQIRWTTNVRPSIGGISFFIVFLISISVIGALPRANAVFLDKSMIGIMASSCLGFLLGLADDAYNTNPLVKFIGQLSCAFILILSDVIIIATGIVPVDYALTVIWVIGLMNSINMLDNMDAITTTTSICIIIGLIAVIFSQGQHFNNYYLIMMVGVLGALIGFLYFNWNPSKIFMGDTGSQFLGVFLAACGILYFWNFKENDGSIIELKQFVVPMLMFVIPLVDTITVTIRRLSRKQSPFVGGKDHITHHLFFYGMKERSIAFLLISVSLLSIPICLALIEEIVPWSFSATAVAFLYFAAVFFGFQYLYNQGAKKKPAEKPKETSFDI